MVQPKTLTTRFSPDLYCTYIVEESEWDFLGVHISNAKVLLFHCTDRRFFKLPGNTSQTNSSKLHVGSACSSHSLSHTRHPMLDAESQPNSDSPPFSITFVGKKALNKPPIIYNYIIYILKLDGKYDNNNEIRPF